MTHSLLMKFGIGFVAGLCAALFPRVIAELATVSESDVITLFSFNYLVLSLVFAVLVGVVIAILEWGVESSPKNIFMSALAIPGILSGALNTSASVKGFEQAEKELRLYETTLQQDFDIPMLSPAVLEPIGDAWPVDTNQSYVPAALFISSAQAAESGFHRVTDYGIGIRKAGPAYVVVLDQAQSREDAEAKAAALRNKTPVRIFRDNRDRYFITTSSGPQTKTNALIEAVRLKKEKGVQASLMQVK